MGCTESKGCLINGDGVSSHYTYHHHHHHNLGRKTTPTTPPIRMPSSLLHGPDIEIQGKSGNDDVIKGHNNHAITRRSLLGGSNSSEIVIMDQQEEQQEGKYPIFVEAPSFKDYLIPSSSSSDSNSNSNDDHHHITNNIINYDGSSDVDEEEEKRRLETPDNSAYASAGEAFPTPIREEPAKMNDAIVGEACLLHKQRQSVEYEGEVIVGEACLLPPRDSMVKKRKVKGRPTAA